MAQKFLYNFTDYGSCFVMMGNSVLPGFHPSKVHFVMTATFYEACVLAFATVLDNLVEKNESASSRPHHNICLHNTLQL